MLKRLAPVFASFHAHDVRYVLIGGIAAILHGVPRSTYDLNILIEATPENAARLLDALREAGFVTADMTTAEKLLESEITVFEDFVPLDVQTRTPGIEFADAWARRETMEFQGRPFFVLTVDDLLATKRAAGREQDLPTSGRSSSPAMTIWNHPGCDGRGALV